MCVDIFGVRLISGILILKIGCSSLKRSYVCPKVMFAFKCILYTTSYLGTCLLFCYLVLEIFSDVACTYSYHYIQNLFSLLYFFHVWVCSLFYFFINDMWLKNSLLIKSVYKKKLFIVN